MTIFVVPESGGIGRDRAGSGCSPRLRATLSRQRSGGCGLESGGIGRNRAESGCRTLAKPHLHLFVVVNSARFAVFRFWMWPRQLATEGLEMTGITNPFLEDGVLEGFRA